MRKSSVFSSIPADKYLITTTITTMMTIMCPGSGRNLSSTGADREMEGSLRRLRQGRRGKRPGFALCWGTCVAAVNMGYLLGAPDSCFFPAFGVAAPGLCSASAGKALPPRSWLLLDPGSPKQQCFLFGAMYELRDICGTWHRVLPGPQFPHFSHEVGLTGLGSCSSC